MRAHRILHLKCGPAEEYLSYPKDLERAVLATAFEWLDRAGKLFLLDACGQGRVDAARMHDPKSQRQVVLSAGYYWEGASCRVVLCTPPPERGTRVHALEHPGFTYCGRGVLPHTAVARVGLRVTCEVCIARLGGGRGGPR